MKKYWTVAILAAVLASPSVAAIQTVTLLVPGMSCAACPFTVGQALKKVKGVSKTEVSFEKKLAVVAYDDAQTNVQALIKATADAGYPSELKR